MNTIPEDKDLAQALKNRIDQSKEVSQRHVELIDLIKEYLLDKLDYFERINVTPVLTRTDIVLAFDRITESINTDK